MRLILLTYISLFSLVALNAKQNIYKINDTISINILIKTGDKHLTEDADTAIIVLKKAMTLSKENKFESGFLRSGFMLSRVYKQKGLFYDAVKTINYLLKYSETTKNKDIKGKCLYTLGEINRAAFYSDNALGFLFEAITIFKELKNLQEQAKCLNRISAVYFEKKSMEKAEAYADSSNKIAIPQKQNNVISSNEELLGAVYRRTKRYNQAIAKLESALHWTMLSKDSTDVPNILNNFAYTYLELRNFDKAIEYADKSFKISVNKDILVYTSNAAQILSDCYRAKNQLEKAYNYLRFRDSLTYKSFMNDRNKTIMDLNEKYEAGKKEKERILLQKDNELKSATIKSQKYLFAFSLFVLIIVSAGTIVIYMGRRKLAKANIQLEFKKEKISKQHIQISEAYDKLKELESFKESMTGMIVHDLKNPLNTIINPSSYQNESQKLESTKQAGYQMLNLVSNILDVQKYETQKMILSKKNVPLIQIIYDAREQVKLLLDQKNITVITVVNPQILIVADAETLIRVFINLLTNAIKYSPNNSEIKINAELKSEQVFIHIEDNGEGIPKDKQEIVFNKFSQVIAKKSGLARSTGLGLAFCKLAIEAHDGTICVSDKPNAGSIFTIGISAKITEEPSGINVNYIQNKSLVNTFSDEEKNYLISIIKQLNTIEIFEISKVREVLNEVLQNPTPSILEWSHKINIAVYSGNGELYKELLRI